MLAVDRLGNTTSSAFQNEVRAGLKKITPIVDAA